MNHCLGGPATDSYDGLSAIVDWVEKGTAPGVGERAPDQPPLSESHAPALSFPLLRAVHRSRQRRGRREFRLRGMRIGRRPFLSSLGRTGALLATASWLDIIGYAQGGRGPARAFIQPSPGAADFDRRVLGSFLEHLGRAIYTGVYRARLRAGRREGVPHRRRRARSRNSASRSSGIRAGTSSPATTGSTASVRRRSARRCSTAPGTRSRRISSAPTSSSTGAGWWEPSRCSA